MTFCFILPFEKGRLGRIYQPDELPVDLKRLEEEQRTIVGIHEIYGEIYRMFGFTDC